MVCGVARDRPIRLGAFLKNAQLSDTVIFVRDSLIKRVEWRIKP